MEGGREVDRSGGLRYLTLLLYKYTIVGLDPTFPKFGSSESQMAIAGRGFSTPTVLVLDADTEVLSGGLSRYGSGESGLCRCCR